jgi:hypothetical protein
VRRIVGWTTVFAVGLVASLALLWRMHGDASLLAPLGRWARPLQIASWAATALQAWALYRRLRGGAVSPRAARLAFYTLALAWLSSLLHPYDQAASYYTLVIGLGVFSAIVSLDRRGPRSRLLDVVAMNVCLLFVGGELGLRAAGALLHAPMLRPQVSDASDWLKANKLEPGSLRLGFPVNESGYYDDPFVRKPSGGCLVTAIGDSFTLGVVPHDWHFTSVAERALGCPIDAFGVGAVGPEEYLLMERDEALALDPDLVLIDVFVGNDLVENLRGRDAFRNGLRRWLDRDNLLTWVVPRRLWAIARHRDRAAAARSPARALSREETLAAYPWIDDPLKEQPTATHDWYVKKETLNLLEYATGDDAWAYRRFGELVREMRARAAGRKFAVMLIPTEPQVEDWLFAEVSARAAGRHTPDGRQPPIERDRPQRLLAAWLAQEGIPTLDLLPLLRAVPPLPDGKRHLYLLDDSHFNVRGNEVAGRALADFLRPLLREPINSAAQAPDRRAEPSR